MLDSTSALAQQSCLPMANLTLVNRQDVYVHNYPAGAYPNKDFLLDTPLDS